MSTGLTSYIESIRMLEMELDVWDCDNINWIFQNKMIRFPSGRGRDKFSLLLSSKVSVGYNLMSFIRGDIVLGICERYGCVE
jgi:hypothetical protein